MFNVNHEEQLNVISTITKSFVLKYGGVSKKGIFSLNTRSDFRDI